MSKTILPPIEHIPLVLEFEVIAPTRDSEVIGDIYRLDEDGYYVRGLYSKSLLFMLDHPAHYRISKIRMQNHSYQIPRDREQNYFPTFHPDFNKYIAR